MAKGKYAKKAAIRDEHRELAERIDVLEREAARKDAQIEGLRNGLHEAEQLTKALRAKLELRVEEHAAPQVEALSQQMRDLLNQRDEARRDLEKWRTDYDVWVKRVINYIMEIDPAKPTVTEVMGVIASLAKGELVRVQEMNSVSRDPEFNQVIADIQRSRARSHGW